MLLSTYDMFTLRKHASQASVFYQADDITVSICNIHGMSNPVVKYPNNIAAIRQAKGNGWTLQRLADMAGLSRGFISLLENGKKQLTQETATKLADALGCSVADIFSGHDSVNSNIPIHNVRLTPLAEASSPQDTRFVPVVGFVQAGAYVEVASFSYVDSETEMVPFYDEKYNRASVRAVRVRGNSTNLIYPDGTIVYFAPAAEIGVCDGDFVIVMQIIGDGIAEFTIKQAIDNNGALELWPRSSDPRYQTPILYHKRDEHSQDGPQIIGIVLGGYKPAERARGPLLLI